MYIIASLAMKETRPVPGTLPCPDHGPRHCWHCKSLDAAMYRAINFALVRQFACAYDCGRPQGCFSLVRDSATNMEQSTLVSQDPDTRRSTDTPHRPVEFRRISPPASSPRVKFPVVPSITSDSASITTEKRAEFRFSSTLPLTCPASGRCTRQEFAGEDGGARNYFAVFEAVNRTCLPKIVVLVAEMV